MDYCIPALVKLLNMEKKKGVKIMHQIKKIGPEIQVSAKVGVNYQPSIAAGGRDVNESILIAWKANNNQIRGQWLESEGGTKQGNDFLITTSPTNIISKPAICGLPSGGFISVWLDEGTRDVKGQRYDVDGAKIGPEFLVGPASGEGTLQPSIRVLDFNTFVVVWTGDKIGSALGPAGPQVQIFNLDGTHRGSFSINTTLDDVNYDPKITWLKNGNFVIAWSNRRALGETYVLAQIFNPDGSKSGGEINVNKITAAESGNIGLTGLMDGNFVVAWVSQGSVMAQIFKPDGSNVHDFELIITEDEQGTCRNPSLTEFNDAGFVATWTTNMSNLTHVNPLGDEVRAKVFNNNGEVVSDSISVNTTTKGDQFGQTMTSSVDNHFVVAWVSDEDPSDNNMSVCAQVLEFSNPFVV